jgi:hypothetical protein
MDEYEDLDIYNGDAVHDMNVNFDRYMNTGEGAELFDETDLDDYIDNLNYWD